jgi:hypothetical protein
MSGGAAGGSGRDLALPGRRGQSGDVVSYLLRGFDAAGALDANRLCEAYHSALRRQRGRRTGYRILRRAMARTS